MRSRTTGLLLACAAIALLLCGRHDAAGRRARAPSFVDTQVQMNILLLQGYINTQAEKNGFVYPARADVKKGGALVAPVWPGNPWTGGTMAPGTSKGTYTYTVKADLSGYTLVGHLSKRLVQGHRRRAQVAQERARRVDQGRTRLAAAVRGAVGADARRERVPPPRTWPRRGAVGLQPGVPIWPQSPWTHAAMTQGQAPKATSRTR